MRYDVSLENFNDGASRAHLIRYYVARGIIDPSYHVIDAACGTGYGSQLLSQIADKVYAFDQIDHIKFNGELKNIVYSKIDLEKPYNYPYADALISLETIEHLTRDGAKNFIDSALSKIRRFFIFSLPLFEEPGANPFHKQVFNQNNAWETVTRPGWKPFHTLMQGNHLLGVLWRDGS